LSVDNKSVVRWQHFRCWLTTKPLSVDNSLRTRAKRKKEKKESKQSDGSSVDRDLGIKRLSKSKALENRISWEQKLLDMRMPFGELRGVVVANIPASKARWLLNKWEHRAKLRGNLKEALTLRVKMAEDERR